MFHVSQAETFSGSQTETFEFLKINKNLFSHVVPLYLAKMSNFLGL